MRSMDKSDEIDEGSCAHGLPDFGSRLGGLCVTCGDDATRHVNPCESITDVILSWRGLGMGLCVCVCVRPTTVKGNEGII